jgi:hypothetical protein
MRILARILLLADEGKKDREIGECRCIPVVNGVTAAEWDELRARLKATYDRLSKMLRSIENWEHNDAIGDSTAIVVHTAYHLGEIRQALCTVGRSGKLGMERRRKLGGRLC